MEEKYLQELLHYKDSYDDFCEIIRSGKLMEDTTNPIRVKDFNNMDRPLVFIMIKQTELIEKLLEQNEELIKNSKKLLDKFEE